jgi:CTP synthase
MEVRDHPWMVGSQFHPEFTSRPNRPNPLFRDFIGAAVQRARGAGVQGLPAVPRAMLPA